MSTFSLSNLFRKFISPKIPKTQTNVLNSIVVGVEAVTNEIETLLKIQKRERNILTATTSASLRNLSAQNGFEPTLKIPSRGIIGLKLNTKLFSRVGYPLYLKPYSNFVCKENGLNYYFDSNTTLKLDNDVKYIALVEGSINTSTYIANGDFIERIYLSTDNIVDGSIIVSVNNDEFLEVKSFIDSENLNDNKQFLYKFSQISETPIILYIKGLKAGDNVSIKFRICNGEYGNLDNTGYNFQTQGIINAEGQTIELGVDESIIQNVSGFNLGSNGTTIATLKSAIGFNHGINLLFDNISYYNFLRKYSSLMLQKIILDEQTHSINNIYIFQKNYLSPNLDLITLIDEYSKIINLKKYLLSNENFNNLNQIIENNEYTLSSHNLFNGEITNYAIQISFESELDKNLYQNELKLIIYREFSYFLYDKSHQINLDLLMNDFKNKYNIDFDYLLFDSSIESKKIELNNGNSDGLETNYTISHNDKLPILNGNFKIIDSLDVIHQLFFDINITIKNS